MKEEYKKELNMNYDDLCNYLKEKYGCVKYPYFCTEKMRSRNQRNMRTKEGLYCHHIDEDKGDNLSNPDFAIKYPKEYQQPDRLVYCNILEHLILHVKICLIRKKVMPAILAFIPSEINDFYNGYKSVKPYHEKLYKPLIDNEDVYLDIIKYLKLNMKISKTEKTIISYGICTEQNKKLYDMLMDKN